MAIGCDHRSSDTSVWDFSALDHLQRPTPQQRPLVHADLSLENVMLGARRRVRLIDFGLSAETSGSDEEASGTDDVLTALHEVGAKPSYLPPEGTTRIPTRDTRLVRCRRVRVGTVDGPAFSGAAQRHDKPRTGESGRICSDGTAGSGVAAFCATVWRFADAKAAECEEGLTRCAQLLRGHPTDAALARLVRSLQTESPDWTPPEPLLPQLVPFDAAVDLVDRLRQSFVAAHVEAFAFDDASSGF